MIQIGSKTINSMYIGSTPIKYIYLGSNKLWPNYAPYSISWLPSTYNVTTTGSSTPTFSTSGSWTSSAYSSAYNGVQYKSNTISANGSTVFKITFSNVASITFACRSYGESNFDYMTIGNLDSTCSRTSYNTSLISKPSSTTYTDVTFTTDGGSHYVQFCYSKDGSVDANDDACYVYIKSVTAKFSTVTVTPYNNYATFYNGSTSLTTVSSPITSSNWNNSANNIRFDTHTTSATIYSQISNLTNTSSMFYNCSSLTSVDFSSWSSNSVTLYSNMFYNCNSLSTIVMNECDNSTIEFIKSRISDASITHDIKLTNSDLGYYWQWSGTSKTWSQIISDYSKIPLCIENNTSTEGTVTLALTGSGVSVKLSTSTDNVNWTTETTYIKTSTFTLPASGKLYLKGSNTQFNTIWSNYYSISANVKHNIYGNVMSLCNYKKTLSDYDFCCLFYVDINLISSENLILPATTLAVNCYRTMFSDCTLLTTAPELPATTLATGCYFEMFNNCKSLTTAPELPATTLATACYNSMLSGCTSLTSAPELPATTLVSDCYNYMFFNSTKLNYIKAMFTTTPSTSYTNNWVYNVSSSGTFIKSPDATWNVTGVNGIPTGWTVKKEYNDYSTIPLCIENNTSTAGTVTLTLTGSSLSVKLSTSVDNVNWTTETTYSATSTFTLPASGSLYLKGSNNTFNTAEGTYYSISANVSHNICGNISSLINNSDTIGTYYFTSLFRSNTNLISAENLILPATTLEVNCYRSMFQDCTSLTDAPELPATNLANDCYTHLFNGCTSLITSPVLPATILADNCYNNMFRGCTSLTTPPSLPATTLKPACYCYMFQGCTSLVNAPILPATTLVTYCYYYMFNGCNKLNYIKAMFTTTPSDLYTYYWVEGVSSSGTFIKNAAATWSVTGSNGIPSGWTVQTATS